MSIALPTLKASLTHLCLWDEIETVFVAKTSMESILALPGVQILQDKIRAYAY